MKPLKPVGKGIKSHKEAHVANTKYGMGDNYGSAIKQKVGKLRGDTAGVRPVTPAKLKNPPKSLA